MLTNVFKLGGFQQVSWFELRADLDSGILTQEIDSVEVSAAHTFAAHLRLQEEGQLSTWSCSSAHAEAAYQHASITSEQVRLWLFLPGCHDATSSTIKANIHGLKVVRAGLWSLPGDSDEISAALVQALLNRLERSMRNLTYVRFGDVFVRSKQSNSNDPRLHSDGLVTCEYSFSASEEAIFVHAVIRKKRIRSVESDDLQTALVQHANSFVPHEFSLPVVVSPYGWLGRLTGSSPSNLVDRLKRSNLQAVNGQAARSLPFPNVSFPTANGSTLLSGNGQSWVHAGYPEVCLGWGPQSFSGMATASGVSSASHQAFENEEDRPLPQANCGKATASDQFSATRRVYIFPAEAVLTPMAPKIPAYVYRKRAWLQNWAGTSWLEESSVPGIMNLASSVYWDGSDYHKIQQWKKGLVRSRCQNPKSSSCSSSSEGDNSAESTSSSMGSSGSSESDGEGEVNAFDIGLERGELLAASLERIVPRKGARRTACVIEGPSQPPENLIPDSKCLQALKRGRPRGGGMVESPSKLARNGSMEDVSIIFEAASDSVSRAPADLNVSSSTPRPPGSQVGTPWDWADDDRGLGIDMQNDADILAEFGDFGDFFEDDVLGFGEPPGTAESQALFSFGDGGEGVNTPGTVCMDTSDPLLLPILDFPSAEDTIQPSFGQDQRAPPSVGVTKEALKFLAPVQSLTPGASQGCVGGEMESLSKAEAMMMFAPGFASVEIPATGKVMLDQGLGKLSYCPLVVEGLLKTEKTEIYVYSATPPPHPRSLAREVRTDHGGPDDVRRGVELLQKKGCAVTEEGSQASSREKAHPASKWQTSIQSSCAVLPPLDRGQASKLNCLSSTSILAQKFRVAQLASNFNCAFLHLQLHSNKPLDVQGSMFASCTHGGRIVAMKEEVSGITIAVDVQAERGAHPLSFEARKKERIPSRIAGDAEEDNNEGHQAAQVGVWRAVGTPKVEHRTQKSVNAGGTFRAGTSAAALRKSKGGIDESFQSRSLRQTQWQEYANVVPLLAQQAAVAVDFVLGGDYGYGPYEWLASQEQVRRLKCCSGGMVHESCGGTFTLRHWLEESGLEIADPLAGEVSPAMVSTVLKRDVRWAMANSFGKTNFDGPLTMTEWYCGRTQSNYSGELAESITSDSKASVICASGGQMGLLETACAPPGLVKGSSSFSSHPKVDDGCHRELGEDVSPQVQGGFKGCDSAIHPLPAPGVLVGYQDDWLTTNISMLRHWEKAPFEPYASPKSILYHVVCLALDPLLSAAGFFFSQLSSVYEVCGLGTHHPAGGASPTGTGKLHPGFKLVDVPGTTKEVQNPLSLPGDYVASMDRWWNLVDYRKALRAVCKSIVLPLNQSVPVRDPELSPSTVIYVVCPTSEPVEMLQTMIDACRSFGFVLQSADSDKGTAYGGGLQADVAMEDAASTPIVAFSLPRFALQVVTADVILKVSGHVSSDAEILKDIAFEVYNKARRIPWRSHVSEPVQGAASRIRPGASVIMQSGTSMPGMWKDCNTNRSSVALHPRDTSLDTGAMRSWETPWQASRMGDLSGSESLTGSIHNTTRCTTRYLYEPAFVLADATEVIRSAAKSAAEKAGAGTPLLSASISETGPSIAPDFSDDSSAVGADLHCCYTWTEDWQWLVSVWTDSRAELLDIHVWPLAGVGGTSLHMLFLEVLHQGFLLLQAAVDTGSRRARNVTITRVGSFTESECQDWQSAILAVGSVGRSWAIQIRHPAPEDVPVVPDRIGLANGPASPSMSALNPRKSVSNLSAKKFNVPVHMQFDAVKGALQCVQSINLVTIRFEHTLQVMCCSEFQASTGPPATIGIQSVSSLASQKGAVLFTPVKSLRFLSSTTPAPAALSDLPPMGQLVLQNSRLVHPVASAFVVTPSTPVGTVSDWPSTLLVGLVSSFSNSNFSAYDGTAKGSAGSDALRIKPSASDSKEQGLDGQKMLAMIAHQLQALSSFCTSPVLMQRRSSLPFHCDIAQKLRRLLFFMVNEAPSHSDSTL